MPERDIFKFGYEGTGDTVVRNDGNSSCKGAPTL
jgi:hypothetical protein